MYPALLIYAVNISQILESVRYLKFCSFRLTWNEIVKEKEEKLTWSRDLWTTPSFSVTLREKVVRNPLMFVDAVCHRRTTDVLQSVGFHLEGDAHGTWDIDAEEQQRFCCERPFVRVEQKQAVMVTGWGLQRWSGRVNQVLTEVAHIDLRRRRHIQWLTGKTSAVSLHK